jgi:excisionase family DNA binding protein
VAVVLSLPSGGGDAAIRNQSKLALIDAFAPVEEIVKPVLTTSEAAQQLGISKSTLIRAVNRGEVRPAFRTPGRHMRFTFDELDEIRRSLGFAGPEAP